MAGKFDAEFMKKHHFWLLLIPATLFVFLACIFVFADVAAETSSIDDKNKAEMAKLDQAKKAAKKTIEKLNEQKKKLEEQQGKMWQQAWSEQQHLFTWPTGYSESKELEAAKKMPFGSTELDDRRFNLLRREFGQQPIYPAEYVNLEKSLEPVQFANGLDSVLKPMKWTNLNPTSEDIWLALEDLWVQREILNRVNQVNKDAAAFQQDKSQPGSFRSSIWEVQLKWERREGADAPKGPGNYLIGQIRNISPRLQVFGIGNLLKLKVWFNDETRLPFEFHIEGTSLPGDPNPQEATPDKWLKIKTIDRHLLPVDLRPTSIFKVEQLFDVRTVPVKRIEAFRIGKLGLGDRTSNLELVMSGFSAKLGETPKESAPKEKEKGSGTGLGKDMMVSSGKKEETKTSASPTSQYGFERARYIAVTKQVRRLPLAFSVVTDQSYLDQILESVANTKLRFQTTQCEWTRFHDTLNYGATPATRAGQAAAPTSSREDQFSANLLVVSIYGIISIEEKYPDPVVDPKKKK